MFCIDLLPLTLCIAPRRLCASPIANKLFSRAIMMSLPLSQMQYAETFDGRSYCRAELAVHRLTRASATVCLCDLSMQTVPGPASFTITREQVESRTWKVQRVSFLSFHFVNSNNSDLPTSRLQSWQKNLLEMLPTLGSAIYSSASLQSFWASQVQFVKSLDLSKCRGRKRSKMQRLTQLT